MLNLSLFKHVVIAAAVLLPACFANAHEYKSGTLQIAHPWSQELPPNAPPETPPATPVDLPPARDPRQPQE